VILQRYTHQQLATMVGKDLVVTDWLEITQDRIDRFADATDDHQWIHVDAKRAKAGPFGRTIAHGYLTLSLVAGFSQRYLELQERMSINYGLNKVRFPAPVPVGSRVRARFTLRSLRPVDSGPGRGVELVSTVTIELEGSDKPACVAEAIRLSFE
jgi:acyl dehydratase